jgi:hypothetical protein
MPKQKQQVRQPDDKTLVAMVRHIIELAGIGDGLSDAIHLIDKDYIVTTIPRIGGDEEFVLLKVNRARQRMLENKSLLAIVMTGWSVGMYGEAVCEYYPAPGQVETYPLSWPRPQISWHGDPDDDPDGSAAIEAYKEIWSLEDLLERRHLYRDL